MTTLEELKRQNEKLRNQLEARKEIEKISQERNKLLRENRALLLKKKYPRLVSSVGKFGKFTKTSGIKVGKGLLRIAKNIEAMERRESKISRKVMSKPRKKAKSTSKRRKR